MDYETRHTFGGLPRFFFGVASADEGTPTVVAGREDCAGLFLFLLPLGRPRPRLTGGESVGAGSAAMKVRKRRGKLEEQTIIASHRSHESD